MSRNISITLGRPLGASLLLGALLATGLVAVGAQWAELSAAVEERDAKADLLIRSVAASRRAALQAPALAQPDPFVAADTATLAAARVDADLRALAGASGLSLRSSRAEAKPEEAQAAASGIGTRIEVQAAVEGSNEALGALLSRLETAAPTVLVDAIAIEAAEQEPGSMVGAGAPRLRASLTLSAYWRPARGGKATAPP